MVSVGLLLTLAIMLSALSFSTSAPELTVQRLSMVSRDTLLLTQTATVGDLEDNYPVLADLFAAGILTQSDRGRDLLDVIGAFWAEGNTTYAENITGSVLSPFFNGTPYNAQILMDGTQLFERNITETARFVIRQRAIASGFEIGKPSYGYISRAWLITATKNNTLIMLGDVITSSVKQFPMGNNGNQVNITYLLEVPLNANISNASTFIETAWIDNPFKVYVNGNFVYQSSGKGLTDITDYIVPGNNTVSVVSRYGSGGAEGGDDGATHFVVQYNTTTLATISNPARFHFYEVLSEAPIRYKKPIFVLGNVSGLNVSLNFTNESGGTPIQNATLNITWKGVSYYISIKNVTNGSVFWNETEIATTLAASGISVTEFSTGVFWVVVDIDKYVTRTRRDYYQRVIRRDTSYVEVGYDPYTIVFGKVDLTTQASLFSLYEQDEAVPEFYRNVTWNVSIHNESEPLAALYKLPWLYYSGANPVQQVFVNGDVLYNHDPNNPSSNPLIVEFARFGYTPVSSANALVAGANNLFSLNFTQGYGIDPANALASVTTLIRSTVGYGTVFANESDAVADAYERLEELLGPFIQAIDISNESQSIGDVPSLWGPAQLDIRIWI